VVQTTSGGHNDIIGHGLRSALGTDLPVLIVIAVVMIGLAVVAGRQTKRR
jgi:hypothetical protein